MNNKSRQNRPSSRKAFTLVELLVVIAIIGVLVALLLPAVQSAREAARRMQCTNNMKQLVIALHSYHDQNGHLPAADITEEAESTSWMVGILPFIEQENLYDIADIKGGFEDPDNVALGLTPIQAFFCPSQPRQRSLLDEKFGVLNSVNQFGDDPFITHYYGILGVRGWNPVSGEPYDFEATGTCGGFAVNGAMTVDEPIHFRRITDGLSNTYLLGELSWSDGGIEVGRVWIRGAATTGCKWTASAKNIKHGIGVFPYSTWGQFFNDTSFGSDHPGGANFANADGSISFVSDSIDTEPYKSAASRDGEELGSEG